MATHYYLVGTTKPSGGNGLTYQHSDKLAIGQLVEISVRGRKQPGIILGETKQPSFTTKPVDRVLDLPPLPGRLVELGQWITDYYVAEPSSVWQTLLPAGALKSRRTRSAAAASKATQPAAKLSDDQVAAIKAIELSPLTTILLRGVTGSGKTEVYQELVRRQLAAGRSSIILVPEISLTPQTEARFRAQFGDQVIITHSRLTEAARWAIWQKALTNIEPLVAIGPRSALFMPLAKLGLIVVDESHETSYKQEQSPRFEATIVAAKLAHLSDSKLILGSATPGLREAYLAGRKVIEKVELKEQFNQIKAARPIIVNLKDSEEFRANPILSRTLLQHLDETYRRGRSSLLFLNRRGSASSQLCTNCQHVTLCPNCQLPLVLHADSARMICHICNYQTTPSAVCPNCNHASLRFLGIGTKRIESELAQIFPKARIARFDKDSLASDGVEALYQLLVDHQVDFLVGTQMIAKGLDLPQMETIGVVLADTSLYLPDFTATERTYDLLTQVSGRAGRGEHPGRTIIQTYSPNHPVIQALSQGDYWDFAEAELAERQLLHYPPFSYLLKLSYSHKIEQTAEKAALALAKQLAETPGMAVVGPAPAFRRYAGGSSHWQIIIKSSHRGRLQQVAATLPGGWTSDLDPVNLL